jgi:hypothetical protein
MVEKKEVSIETLMAVNLEPALVVHPYGHIVNSVIIAHVNYKPYVRL